MAVTISSAVRTNLLSLQGIASQQSTVQNRLATGKKVNSALDNATSFFTASSFTSRAASLSSLQDSIATGVQTLQAANNGLTSITSLVSQLRSTAQQALQSTSAYSSQAKVTSSTAITGATSADLRGLAQAGTVTATGDLSSLVTGVKSSSTATSALSSLTSGVKATTTSTGTVSALTDVVPAVKSGTVTDTASLAQVGSGHTLIINDGSGAHTFTQGGGGATGFTDLATLNAALTTAGVNVQASVDGSNHIAFTATNHTASVNVTGTGATDLGVSSSTASATAGSALNVSDGTNTASLTFDSTATSTDYTKFKNISDLNAKLAHASVKATATDDGSGHVVLAATAYNTNLTVTGAGATPLGLGNASATTGSVLTINDGTTTKNFVYDANAASGDNTAFKSISDLNTKLGSLGVKATASADATTNNLKLTESDYSTTLAVSGTASSTLGLSSPTTATSGDVLTVNDGTTSKSFHFDSSSASSDTTSFKSIDDLNSKLSTLGVKATATQGANGKLKLTASDNTTTVAVTGTAAAAGKLNVTGSIAPSDTLDGKSLTFTTSAGKTATVTFGDPANGTGAIKSLDDLNTKLAGVGLSGSLDSSGNLTFTTTSTTASQTFSISGTATNANFSTTGSTTAVRGGTGADTRDSLVTQYNSLLTQIDSAAKDSNFNGLNLLSGDTLSLIFNETNTSKLDVNGTSANSTGLGLSTIAATDFNDGNGINAVLTKIDTAKNSLATQSSKLGSNLAVVQTRQDFTKNTINTLQTGSDNLVNADLNEEATNLLSLNTSQSLAQQALSLANQSQQSVLQLLR